MNLRCAPRLVAAVALLLAGCSAPGQDGADPDGARAPDLRRSVDQPADGGTRDNPLPAGVAFELDDWNVRLGDTNRDATEAVRGENRLSEVAAGRVPVMVPVTVTYTGAESATAWIDLVFSFLGGAGNAYSYAGADQCGLIPDALTEVGEMFPGASDEGNVCIAVPATQVNGGMWIVESLWVERRVFVALR